MIRGVVNTRREAVVRLRVRGPSGAESERRRDRRFRFHVVPDAAGDDGDRPRPRSTVGQ